jgi:hypothetical protein
VGLTLPAVRGEERQRTNPRSQGWCDGGTADGVEGGGRGTEGSGIDGTTSREVGSGMEMGVGDDDGVTLGGVEAKGGDDVASREVAEAPREVASMARHRGRRRCRGRETWVA